ncbi:MAG: hypothetical protein ACR2RV_09710 [Verrucomicrobiales bacterium]
MWVAGVGLGAIAIAGAWANRARIVSLTEDVAELNARIIEFIRNGGSLAGIRGIEPILEALKVGGARIDLRLSAEIQTCQQASSGELRAVWDPTSHRVVVSGAGGEGARRFHLSPADSALPAA